MNRSNNHTLVLDVGTTGVKAFIFDSHLAVVVKVYKRLSKNHPKPGWVEQDPKELLFLSKEVLRQAVATSKLSPSSFLALGMTNQRETIIGWNKSSGKALYPAIVWEDTRTRKTCFDLKKKYDKVVREKTGLAIDPYFSAPKMGWILQNVAEARRIDQEKELAFGTVDSWLLYNFLEGNPHLTDYSNASRTLLFNIKTLAWDDNLLEMFGISLSALPQVLPSRSFFGNLKKEVIGFSLPVQAVCGDQQASLYAAGIKKGTTKITYGTGTFIMQVLGTRFALYDDFFTTLVPNSEKPIYLIEAKIGGTGKRVDERLKRGMNIDLVLTRIAQAVNSVLNKLPVKPKILMIDGGITQDSQMAAKQAKISQIRVKAQPIYDGTALGVAKLLIQPPSASSKTVPK